MRKGLGVCYIITLKQDSRVVVWEGKHARISEAVRLHPRYSEQLQGLGLNTPRQGREGIPGQRRPNGERRKEQDRAADKVLRGSGRASATYRLGPFSLWLCNTSQEPLRDDEKIVGWGALDVQSQRQGRRLSPQWPWCLG